METIIYRNKKLSLVLGVIIAMLVGYIVPANAGNDSESKKNSLSTEDYQFFKEYFSRESQDTQNFHTYYIYDIQGNLIHHSAQETEQIIDDKLQSLLFHSDLIMNFDNTSYLITDQ